MGVYYPTVSVGTNQIRSAGRLPYGQASCTGLVVSEIAGFMRASISFSGIIGQARAISTATLSCFAAYGDITPLPVSYSDGDYAQSAPNRRLHYYSTQETLLGPGEDQLVPLFSTIEYGKDFQSGWNYTISNIVVSWTVTLYPYTPPT